ncbi:hypothetical protein ACIRVK_25155 [Streptomyces sp. NPDC101152]|uniref:hypothetical protein n=1 Tax=Streptomyces sp. NPDC101152 TaxID=3366116 RepID=UPI0037FBC0E4
MLVLRVQGVEGDGAAGQVEVGARRAKPGEEQLQRLAGLGLDWAARALGTA